MKISGYLTAKEVYDNVSQPVGRVQLVGREVPFSSLHSFFFLKMKEGL
jgi:hypothetical protein